MQASLSKCNKKIASATKFIDFFVHDILDYTILNKNERIFTKNTVIFDINDAVSEITETFEDKLLMKNISIHTKFIGFKKDKSSNF